jgi:beta-glucosidase
MEDYGVTGYRFSLAWTRAIPLGAKNDPVNERRIRYCNGLINELLSNGTTPFVTLLHWESPQGPHVRYGDLLDTDKYTPGVVRYARVCFRRFGDRVKNLVTYNEPGLYTLSGYSGGVHAPGRLSDREQSAEGDSSTEPLIVGHNGAGVARSGV